MVLCSFRLLINLFFKHEQVGFHTHTASSSCSIFGLNKLDNN